MEALVILAIVLAPGVILGVVGYLFIIRPMKQEARGYEAMARSLRRMREEAEADGRNISTEARAARDILRL